jgi:lipoprotein NlpD
VVHRFEMGRSWRLTIAVSLRTVVPKLCTVSLFIFCLIGCGGNDYRAPVERRYSEPKAVPTSYAVQRGDTLYSIAFRYGLDYRALALANNISSSFTIYPGQKLLLVKGGEAKKVAAVQSKPVKPKPAVKPVMKAPSPTPARTTSKAIPKVAVKALPKPATTRSNVAVSQWRWPTVGKVVRGYSSSVHKGIDISGERGDPIYAVAAGQVVYAGTGIVGFGELLIVKHNEVYLSAYGHNSRLLVDEGETVKAGQKIAEKGSSGTNTIKLHFEIRKEGKPIDPKKLLP